MGLLRGNSGFGFDGREFRPAVWNPGTEGAFGFPNESPLSENRGVTRADSNTLLRSERNSVFPFVRSGLADRTSSLAGWLVLRLGWLALRPGRMAGPQAWLDAIEHPNLHVNSKLMGHRELLTR